MFTAVWHLVRGNRSDITQWQAKDDARPNNSAWTNRSDHQESSPDCDLHLAIIMSRKHILSKQSELLRMHCRRAKFATKDYTVCERSRQHMLMTTRTGEELYCTFDWTLKFELQFGDKIFGCYWQLLGVYSTTSRENYGGSHTWGNLRMTSGIAGKERWIRNGTTNHLFVCKRFQFLVGNG